MAPEGGGGFSGQRGEAEAGVGIMAALFSVIRRGGVRCPCDMRYGLAPTDNTGCAFAARDGMGWNWGRLCMDGELEKVSDARAEMPIQ